MNFIELLQLSEQESYRVKMLLQHYRCVYCFFIVLSVFLN